MSTHPHWATDVPHCSQHYMDAGDLTSGPQAFFSINPASTGLITIKGMIFAYSHVRNWDSATASTSVKVVTA